MHYMHSTGQHLIFNIVEIDKFATKMIISMSSFNYHGISEP
jgi:hypothetical protein